ncbi:MAG: IPT/TIG domain-containing protein [Deltaproteobacteria bacterium]|nr:IPT/TIG domain-containing protein [Deltaproteobacteria bacterium]MCL5792642.1 IPT/TIG domain-containing protein [Deltaproteobacteria bacterium]
MKKLIYITLSAFAIFAGCSKTTTGPAPQPLSITPGGGYNQSTIPVTITGNGFQAVPFNILSGNLTTKLPQVYLSTSPITHLSMTKVSQTVINATVPSGISVAAGTWVTYSVTVVNPTGKSGTLKNAYIVSSYPPPTISSASICSMAGTVVVNIGGTSFFGIPNVTVVSASGNKITTTVNSVSSTSITATTGTGLSAGTYTIIVTNPDSQQTSASISITQIHACISPVISSIEPKFGWTNADTNITISGMNFSFPATVIFAPAGSTAGVKLTYVAYVSSSQIQAVVPNGMAVGWYDITVQNPDGQQAVYPSGFYVSANPPPVITSISPASGSSNALTSITITGNYFASDATAETIDSTGAINVCSISAQSSTIITCTTAVLATGVYVIRVTNTSDNTYYDYSSFIVTNPAQNVGNTNASTSQLIIGRQGLTSVTGHDNIGDRFIYAIGGDDGIGRHTLDSVEYAQPDRFGNLNPFNLTSPLIYKTTGAAAFQYNGYVYVLGGLTPSSGYTSVIERAKILTTDSTPVVSFEGLSAFTTGTLPAGTWVYEVSANLPTGTTYIGESLPSPVVFTTTTQTGSIQVSWQPVSVWSPVTNSFITATGYNVYRNTPGTFRPVLIAWNISGRSFVDNGTSQPISITDTTSGFPTTIQDPTNLVATPSSSGGTLSAGTYYYRVSAVNYRGESPALNFASVTTTSNTSYVTLKFNPVPEAEYYKVYRSPSPDIRQGNEVLLVPVTLTTTITDDGSSLPVTMTTPSDGYIPPLPYGSLGPFGLVSASLSSARGYLGAAVGHTQTGTVYGYAVGGTANGSTGLSTVDSIQLSAAPITEASATTGRLAASTYTYAVTAIVPDGELAYAGTFQTSVTGGIQFTWASVPDASSYNIYRDSGHGLEYIGNIVSPTTAFSDNGSVSPTPGALPMGGGIGNIFATASLQTARCQLSALSADKTNLPLAITDTSGYIYAVTGYNGAVINTTEVSRIQGDGRLEPFQYLKTSNGLSNASYTISGQITLVDTNNFFYFFAGYPLTHNIEDFEFGTTPYTLHTGYPNNDGGKTLTYRYLGAGILLGPYFYLIGGTSNGSPTTMSSDTVLNTIEQVIY